MKSFLLLLGLGFVSGLFFFSSSPVTFESLESKTTLGGPVFNRIRFLPGWNKDIWLMQQSHDGYHEAFKRWDRLAIVVDKTVRPFISKFYQLESGDLQFAGPAVAYKARCFACHANGPRAVRWNAESQVVVPSIGGKLQVFLWNLRIKAYGPVASLAGAEFNDGAPFRSRHAIFSRALGLKTCERCHSSGGLRNELKLEQLGTAAFLVGKGIMPPFPFSATEKEKEFLKENAAL